MQLRTDVTKKLMGRGEKKIERKKKERKGGRMEQSKRTKKKGEKEKGRAQMVVHVNQAPKASVVVRTISTQVQYGLVGVKHVQAL